MPGDDTIVDPEDGLVCSVQRLVSASVREAFGSMQVLAQTETDVPGGLLRTRMAARLARDGAGPVLEQACAAAEVAHVAMLCHDCGSQTAHFCPVESPSAPILVGDALLCQALDLIVGLSGGRYIVPFSRKVREACGAAAERALLAQGGNVDHGTTVRLARGLGGGLFSFAAQLCDGRDANLSAALEEAGYCVGTACHLASADHGLRAEVDRQCASALDCLDGWPHIRGHLADFLAQDAAALLGP